MSVPDRARTVAEAPVWLEVDGARHATWTATPDALRELALGRLLADGYIMALDDLLVLEIVTDSPAGAVGLRAAVRDSRRALETRRHLAAHGCGALGLVGCLGRIRHRTRSPLPAPGQLADLLAALFERAESDRSERGGMHAAGAAHGGTLHFVATDVSRHSAVDKAIGGALLAGLPLRETGLILSARISGDMAAKAAVADMAYVASRSVPTTLAVEVAASAGLPLVARAASAHSEVHGP